ncbi:MAG: MFS transporter [Candidatus Nanopelagicales bacterium]|nr:MFS transporter [Candidatus Nanopelagicales bacterium]
MNRRNYSPNAIIAVLAVSGAVMSIMQTVFIPLLPEIPALLDCTPEQASWLITATLISSSVAIPSVAKLADMYGKRRMMLVSLGVLICGSVLGAVGTTFTQVLVARIAQGFAMALIPIGMSIMRDQIPPERLPGAVALMSGTMGIGAGIGLPLGGLIFQTFGWHAVFWVSAITGTISVIAILIVVPESPIRSGGRFDYLGAGCISVWLTALLLAITKGEHWGWSSPPILGLFAGFAIVFLLWIPWELRVSQPVIDLRTTAHRPVMLTNITTFIVGIAMYANMLSSTQLLEMPTSTGYGFGFTVFHSGLALLPSALAMVLMAPVAARIVTLFGPKMALITGGLVLAGGYLFRTFFITGVWEIMLGAIIVSSGTMIAFSAAPNIIMRVVPITETSAANGLNNVMRTMGTSVSSAAVAAVLTGITMEVGGQVFPQLRAFQVIYVGAMIAALVGVGVAAFLPRRFETSDAALAAGAAALAHQEPALLHARPHEFVLHGTVTGAGHGAVRDARVTFMTPDGEQIDFERTDAQGGYAVVLPQPGPYRVVVEADGWQRHDEVADVDRDHPPHAVDLEASVRV